MEDRSFMVPPHAGYSVFPNTVSTAKKALLAILPTPLTPDSQSLVGSSGTQVERLHV